MLEGHFKSKCQIKDLKYKIIVDTNVRSTYNYLIATKEPMERLPKDFVKQHLKISRRCLNEFCR